MSVEIIAEVAQGYEGNPTLAGLLARAAVRAGADAVKYQLVYADEIATPDYQYYDLFRRLESLAAVRREGALQEQEILDDRWIRMRLRISEGALGGLRRVLAPEVKVGPVPYGGEDGSDDTPSGT